MDNKRKIEENATCVVCPIIYGSLATWLGKQADETSTHRWTLFVRGPNEEDLSTFVSQVCFTLHPSFAEPLRIVKEPPYEVTENGWGEFEAGIRIIFRDPNEQPIDLTHHIKLYPPVIEKQPNLKKPVMSEVYDEIVFTNPKETFYRMLMMYKKTRYSQKLSHLKDYYTIFDDQSNIQHLTFIENQLLHDIDDAKAKLLQLENELHYLQHTQTTTTTSSSSTSHNTTSAQSTVHAPPVTQMTSASAGNHSTSMPSIPNPLTEPLVT